MEFVEDSETPTVRVPCLHCNRQFVPKSLAKHAVVCERTLNKKRKTFDSAKQRIQGTELAEFLPTVTSRKSETFIVPMKARPVNVQKMMNTTKNVPSRMSSKVASLNISSNYERCPYCDRTFGPKAFDRHIEWCKEQSLRRNENKPSASQGLEEAKCRLELRTRYRAPSFRSKRSITREKYSPKSSLSDCSSVHLKSEDRNNNYDVRRKKSLETELKIKFPEKLKSAEPVRETNFIRQNVLRCSYKPRVMKKAETKSEKNHSIRTKKKEEYSNVRDWISANGPKMNQCTRSSKIKNHDSPFVSSSHDDYPDPYLLAEHQLKELLSNDQRNEEPISETIVKGGRKTPSSHTSKDERRSKVQNKENISYGSSSPVKTISCQTDNDADPTNNGHFKTSPSSAFEKYAPNNGDETLLNSNNFLPSIESIKPTSDQKSHEGQNMNRYPLISLSNLSLCSSVSIDIPEEKYKVGTCKSAEVRGSELPAMKRSISASIDKPTTNRNFVKKNLKVENMLYGDEQDWTPTHHGPFTEAYDEKLEKQNDVSVDETFDLANSFSEFEEVLQSSYYDNNVRLISSDLPLGKRGSTSDRDDSTASKMSFDSAYNSLNRKSPMDLTESRMCCGKTSTPETRSCTSSVAVDTSSQNQQAQPTTIPLNFLNERVDNLVELFPVIQPAPPLMMKVNRIQAQRSQSKMTRSSPAKK